VKKRRGPKPGSRMHPVMRALRMTGNPNRMAALLAQMYIEADADEEAVEKEPRRITWTADGFDTPPRFPLPPLNLKRISKRKKLTHKEAVRLAIEDLSGVVTKAKISIRTDARGHRLAVLESDPKALRKQPDPRKVLDMVRRRRPCVIRAK
jgi:hypothetical protein